MLHPLLRILATQPELLGNHAQAYGELLSDELGQHAHALGKRAILVALAVCFLGVASVLCGTACLLWAMAMPSSATLPGVMVAVPLVPAALSVACFWASRTDVSPDKKAFSELRRQAQADIALLRAMGSP